VIKTPVLTVITPVSLDHTEHLGDSVEKIAFEKAGIMKPGVEAVIAAQLPGAAGVIERRAEEVGAPLYRQGVDWHMAPSETGFRYRGRRWQLALPHPALPGAHQLENAALAVAAAERLAGFQLAAEHVSQGVLRAQWPARLQRLRRGPLVELLPQDGWELWLDGGHNASAGQALARHAKSWRDKPLGLVYGMLKTKDARQFLAPLAPYAAALRAVGIPGEAASLSAEEALAHARASGHEAAAAASVAEATAELVRVLARPSRILICGSLYLAGKVLAENG